MFPPSIMRSLHKRQSSNRALTALSLSLLFVSSLALSACESSKEEPPPPVDMAVDMEVDMEVDMYISTIDDRCPTARSGELFVVLFADRVELFQPQENQFKVRHFCTLISHTEQGAETVQAMAVSPDGRFFLLSSEGDAGGSIYIYSNNGEFERKEGPNVNLKDAQRIWALDEGFVVWVERNGSLYKLDADGSFAGTYMPPQSNSGRLVGVTDMEYIGEDAEGNPWLLSLFADRAPKLFAFPDSPELSGVNGAKAVATLDTPVGKKLLISGRVEGDRYGVALFRQVNSGRTPPDLEEVLVLDIDDGYGDGSDIVSFADGFFVLDRGGDGERAPALNSFNTFGTPQEQNPLGVEGTPIGVFYMNVFSDF